MKITSIVSLLLAVALPALVLADENHEIIEKVMKEGLKGKTSPLAKVLDGEATEEETAALAELVQTMKETHPPRGEKEAYNEKVAELIAAMNAVAEGDTGPAAIERLDKAANCKACHSEHKPE